MATSAQYMAPQIQGSPPTRRSSNRSRSNGSNGSNGARVSRSQLDHSLGWFSLGLGLVEVLAPRTLGRMIGVGEHTTALRMCGLREIASGLGLLSGRAPAAFAASRVVGDAMDLALLGAALRSPDCNPARVAVAATAVAGVAALDLYASKLDMQAAIADAPQDVPVTVSLTINQSPEQIYQFWRQLENLPRFMQHLESVRDMGERTSQWTAKGPGGMRVQWQSEIVEDQPNEYISWRTVPGSEVNHCGSVSFEAAPAGSGTVVRVEMYFGIPGGKLGARAARWIAAAPESVVKGDLRRLKQLLETGEVATTRGQPTGARSVIGRNITRGES